MVWSLPEGRSRGQESRGGNGGEGDRFESRYGTLARSRTTLQRHEYSKLPRAQKRTRRTAATGSCESQSNEIMVENRRMTVSFIYGTAWKKDATTDLVQTAVRAGFKAIDT